MQDDTFDEIDIPGIDFQGIDNMIFTVQYKFPPGGLTGGIYGDCSQ